MALNAATVSGPSKWVIGVGVAVDRGVAEKVAGIPERAETKDVGEFVGER